MIGSFFPRPNDEYLLDLRSCERAILAIPFFDENLPRRLVKIEHAEIANRLFPATEANLRLSPDALFDSWISAESNQKPIAQQLVEKFDHVQDPEERRGLALADLRSRANEPLPEIERISVHFAEDGIDGFKLVLRLRQIVAMQRWLGLPEYTLDDALRSVSPTSRAGGSAAE